jgi:hypothetical protein
LSIGQHWLAGTLRADRHGALALKAHADPPPATEISRADRRRLVAALGEPGRRFVTAELAEFTDWSAAELVQLRRRAEIVDRLDIYRAAIEASGGPVQTGRRGAQREHPLAAAVRAETRTLIALTRARTIEG